MEPKTTLIHVKHGDTIYTKKGDPLVIYEIVAKGAMVVLYGSTTLENGNVKLTCVTRRGMVTATGASILV